MSINWERPKFKNGDKVVICDWNEVIKAIEDDEETNWSSVKRRLECARLYGGKSAIVMDWGPDVYSKEGQTDIVNIYRLADESGAIIPFAFMDCMLTRWEPSGVEAKSADGAAEEKSTDRPQIQVGDIVRVEISDDGATHCCVVWDVRENGVYADSGANLFSFEQVAAIYRFDGRDVKCIWESEAYELRKWKEALANAAEAARRAGVSLKEVTAAFERLIKEKSGETRKEKSND